MTYLLIFSILAGQLIKIPFGSGGITLLDITVGILCLWGVIQAKFRLTKLPTWIIGGFLFSAVAIVSLLLSPLNLDSNQKLISFSYILRFSALILLGWVISSKDLTKTLTFSGFILACLGLTQLIFLPNLGFLGNQGWDPHYFRVVSTFLDPNFMGAFFALTLLLLTRHSREGGNPINKMIVWIPKQVRDDKFLFGIVYLSLLVTFSRGAYLAFGISFLSLAILKRSKNLLFLTIILSLGLYFGYTGYQQLVAQPRNIDREQSASSRLDTWQQGLELFQQHPILGVGFNSYKFALEEKNLANEQFLNSRGSSYNDSSLLHVAATTGIIGLTSYLFFLGSLIWAGFKYKNYILVAGLVGLLAQSFFSNTLFYPFLLIWIILVSDVKFTHE